MMPGESQRKITYTITITAFDDGDVQVTNFPAKAEHAVNIMLRAAANVSKFFINAGIEGKLRREEPTAIDGKTHEATA